jgi:hypothetical protein
VRSDRLPVAAALVMLGFAVVGSFVLPATETQRGGDDAAHAFLSSWRRMLTGTYVVESSFGRGAPGASTFSSATRLVQRPPDRLLSGRGAVDGRLNGKVVRCGTDADGVGRCFEGAGEAPAFDQAVNDEVDALSSYVLGDRPAYAVVDFLDGCYRLDLRVQIPAPYYGNHALFCFDPATGAASRTVIDRGDVVEMTVADFITPVVTDADLVVPEDRGETEVLPGATSTTTSTTSPTTTSS